MGTEKIASLIKRFSPWSRFTFALAALAIAIAALGSLFSDSVFVIINNSVILAMEFSLFVFIILSAAYFFVAAVLKFIYFDNFKITRKIRNEMLTAIACFSALIGFSYGCEYLSVDEEQLLPPPFIESVGTIFLFCIMMMFAYHAYKRPPEKKKGGPFGPRIPEIPEL